MGAFRQFRHDRGARPAAIMLVYVWRRTRDAETGAAVDPLGSWILLGMQRGLSGLEIGHHFLGSIDGELIIDREQYSPITLDRLVDFRALFTHNCRPILGGSERPPVTYLRWRQCFVSIEN
jgi:hypothetical protein